MEQVIPISKNKYYKAMLTIVGSLLPTNLTTFEIEMIATMFTNNIKTLDKITRLELRNLLNTSEYNFNNYIKKLKNKSVLIENNEGLEVHPNITNAIEDKKVTIEFNVS